MPWRTATRFTSGVAVARPRPRGRSGWQTTPTTGSGRARSASSVGHANAGVPMNTMRQVVRSEERARARALPSLALELALSRPVEVALQPGETIEKEPSLEMVDLVLEHHREQRLGLNLDLALV